MKTNETDEGRKLWDVGFRPLPPNVSPSIRGERADDEPTEPTDTKEDK